MTGTFLTIEKYTPHRSIWPKLALAFILLVVPIFIVAAWAVTGLNTQYQAQAANQIGVSLAQSEQCLIR